MIIIVSQNGSWKCLMSLQLNLSTSSMSLHLTLFSTKINANTQKSDRTQVRSPTANGKNSEKLLDKSGDKYQLSAHAKHTSHVESARANERSDSLNHLLMETLCETINDSPPIPNIVRPIMAMMNGML